ncbi:IS5 family transposase ISOt6 [Orientia tsutsugamushi]|nr:putative transposase [Orientia tsutsugamushi str. TA763]SPP26241.1 IS5 family transposase ISOt6 [Orientia tsutsugamushi]
MVDKKTHKVMCTDFSNCKKHDFRLFKKSKILINPKVKVITETIIGKVLNHNDSQSTKFYTHLNIYVDS